MEKIRENFRNGLQLIDEIALKHFPTKFEVRKQIQGYLNYSISSFGRVRNDNTRKIVKSNLNKNNYNRIQLWKNATYKYYYVHRLVANAFIPNSNNKNFVDHIDHNTQNNIISNLRWCTRQENNINRSLSSNNKSSVKGVYFDKSNQKYRAFISTDGKKIHLGYFATLEEAKQARQNKAKKIFGEFANE